MNKEEILGKLKTLPFTKEDFIVLKFDLIKDKNVDYLVE